MTDIRTEIEAAITRLSDLVNAKDVDLLAQFDHSDDLIFVGSEMYEVHLGVPDVENFFTTLRDAHLNITWDFKAINTGHEGDIVWFLAEGEVHIDVAGLVEVRPYRLSGVLVRRDGMLKWRQFHGSEPRP